MKFMIFYNGRMPCAGNTESHHKRWQSWMDELKSRGILEEGAPYGGAGKIVNKLGSSERKCAKDGLAGYIIVNVSTKEEAIEIAKEAPNITLNGPLYCNSAGDVRVLGFQVC